MTAGKGVCAVDDCPKDVKVKGWCMPHYRRWHQYGDPTGQKMPTPEPPEHLEAWLTARRNRIAAKRRAYAHRQLTRTGPQ